MKIFDVCWTMYQSNTTFDYIRFVYKSENIQSFQLKFLNSKFGKIIILLLGRIIGRDLYRELFVKLLKGFSRKDLEELSMKFYQNFLINQKIDYTFKILEKTDVNDVILCSASLDVVVAHIAKELGVVFFASELEYKKQICTGKISKDLLGKKDNILKDKVIELVVTDNLSDLELVRKSLKSVILSTPKNVKFWEMNDLIVDYILKD